MKESVAAGQSQIEKLQLQLQDKVRQTKINCICSQDKRFKQLQTEKMSLEETIIKQQSAQPRNYTGQPDKSLTLATSFGSVDKKPEDSSQDFNIVRTKSEVATAAAVDMIPQEVYDNLKVKFLDKESEIDEKNNKLRDLQEKIEEMFKEQQDLETSFTERMQQAEQAR